MMLNADYLTKAGGYRAVYRGSAISSGIVTGKQ